jgi:type I site-specific restriction endonuclease
MKRRTVRLTVRLTDEEGQRLTEAAQKRGYQGVAQLARASLARWETQAQVIDEVQSLEKRQAATLTAMRTEIARLQRTDYVLFAMLENLAKTILTYMPPPAAENKASVIAQGRAGYERYLRAVGISLHNGSKAAVERLAGLDE